MSENSSNPAAIRSVPRHGTFNTQAMITAIEPTTQTDGTTIHNRASAMTSLTKNGGDSVHKPHWTILHASFHCDKHGQTQWRVIWE